MTDSVLAARATRGDRLVPLMFAATVFASAALVFMVQPMVTKLVLPRMGGSPQVWNTALVFFQLSLLIGYGYAHALQRIAALRVQIGVHLALLILAGLFLPLGVSERLGDPDTARPILWLLGTLTISIGAPFAILSATAPLIQAWFARVRADRPDGANPYVLYAASNLGSFIALIAYPLVVEPAVSLTAQRMGWSVGYGLFVLMILGLGWMATRRGAIQADAIGAATPMDERGDPIPWSVKGWLILLAAAPSSLMLGVTTHLSTDVASAPFLWVAPLALYLLTFVIAFSARPLIPLPLTLVFQAALGAATVTMVAFRTGEWVTLFGLHLVGFFFAALMCHQLLARLRPQPARLTEFYLLLSLGGVLGGAFTTLVAPAVFPVVWEYPLVLVLVCLLRPPARSEIRRREVVTLFAGLLICAVPPVLSAVFEANWDLAWAFNRHVPLRMEQLAMMLLGVASILAFTLRDRRWMFAPLIAAIALCGQHTARGYDWSFTERSFFGVLRVAEIQDPILGGPIHVMMHGTTLHGAQPQNPAFACRPTLYYAPATPIGQATAAVQARGPVNIGVVGQGAGAMAGFKRADDRLTFFEIDPMVDRVARDPRWFSFINGCAEGPVRTVLGDARLTMAAEPRASYDLILLDAFSSDAIPTHLLTQEAMADYLSLLKPDGVLVMHLSNRNLDITRPTVAAAERLGAPYLHQVYFESDQEADMAEASAEVLMLSPTPEGLREFVGDARWTRIDPQGVRPWTDDYVNLIGAVARKLNDRGG